MTTSQSHRPLTQVSERDLPKLRVSRESVWADTVWQLEGIPSGTPRSRGTLDWNIQLMTRDGRHAYLTDPEFSAWLDSAKRFLWTLRTDPPPGRKRQRDPSLANEFGSLRVLIRWLAAQGYTGFDALDPDLAEQFLAFVETRHVGTDTDAREPNHKVGKQRKAEQGRALTARGLLPYAAVLKDLYIQGDKYPGAPGSDPLPGETAGERAGDTQENQGKLPYTPETVAVPLVRSAMRLLGTSADDVMALCEHAQSAYDESRARHKTKSTHTHHALAAVKDFTFSIVEGETQPWREGPITSTKEIGYLRDRIVDAAFVVIAYLCGPRASEIVSLKAGCVEYERHASDDGIETFSYFRGDIHKTDEPGHLWVAPPEAVRAVEVMERLSRPLRERSGREELFLATKGHGGVIAPSSITVLSSDSLIRRLNDQFAPFIELPYYQGKPWHVTTHQGRKTFARFIAKKDWTNLYALKDQFGHVTRAMTDKGYAGTDYDLFQEILYENRSETVAILEELLTAETLAGQRGKEINARSPFRGRVIDEEVTQYAMHLVESTDLTFGGCDWGICVYRQDRSACGGDANGPNPVHRDPYNTCFNCANFAVSKRNRPFWAGVLEQNQKILAQPNLPDDARRVCEARIEICNTVLSDLNGEET